MTRLCPDCPPPFCPFRSRARLFSGPCHGIFHRSREQSVRRGGAGLVRQHVRPLPLQLVGEDQTWPTLWMGAPLRCPMFIGGAQVRAYGDRAWCWNIGIPYKRAYALSSYALTYVALSSDEASILVWSTLTRSSEQSQEEFNVFSRASVFLTVMKEQHREECEPCLSILTEGHSGSERPSETIVCVMIMSFCCSCFPKTRLHKIMVDCYC